jgi:predicted aspartyl protease
MLYLHDYNAVDYNPAAPEIEIRLSLSEERPDITLRGLIDSGADTTSIPIRYLEQIRAMPGERKWLRGVAGGRYRTNLYPVYLQIGAYGFYVSVVADPLYQEVLIGRDILNLLIVTLNGLAHVVEIREN